MLPLVSEDNVDATCTYLSYNVCMLYVNKDNIGVSGAHLNV